MENKKAFIARFLDEAIEPLADTAYQQRVWINCEGPEMDCYDETINEFSYFYSNIVDSCEEYELSEDEIKKIIITMEKIRKHGSLASMGLDEEIIGHPSWKEVVEAAKDVKQALERYKGDWLAQSE